MGEAVLFEKQGNVAVITLNRPEALNSINRQLKSELALAFTRLDEDNDIRVGIVTGTGRAFCAGRDLTERAADTAAGIQAHARDSISTNSLYMWSRPYKPLIAAINGFALAGGWSIAQLCDLRIASDNAKLGITEAKWGLLPPFATILPRTMPMSAVLEMVFTAEPITAQRAHEIGFLNKVVPQESLMEEALALASKIAENAPLSTQYFKELAYKGLEISEEEMLNHVEKIYDYMLLSDDAKEGPKAFAEKRRPDWKGS